MSAENDRIFGSIITRLINKQNLSREETRQTFLSVLNNETTEMQQGAFLAALTSKGETEQEVAGAWEAIYEADTVKVKFSNAVPVVDNSGTGMDTFKTFNISTAASIIAASQGIPMARHGSRAITSVCGTVDMAEALGVDVDCTADVVAKSIETSGIGLFNGMSPHIHPNALGRILSQIYFGSTLNIAASLANPALPNIGVRGVYSREMVMPVARVMKEVGYKNAIVLHGTVDGTDLGMDEASVCGKTYCAHLTESGDIHEFEISPADFGMGRGSRDELSHANDIQSETKRFTELMNNKSNGPRKEAALLNAGLIFYVAGKSKDINDGISIAADALESGNAFNTLEQWVSAQSSDSEKGLQKLYSYLNY
ncbi:MAG: anthranilate phosphoribosyltransferase [Spirochaetes bacterium]|nr:anthranilate phosphoribosyltransferase [Spirochaetota bacterium]